MSNLPQRVFAKKDVKIALDADVHQAMKLLAARSKESLSSIVESILLLSKLIYSQELDDSFIGTLRDVKVQRLSSLSDLRRGTPSIRCHLTIDQEAAEFAHMLRKTYQPVFSSYCEAVHLCLAWAAGCCKEEVELEHFLRRLESTQLVFPKHKKKGTP